MLMPSIFGENLFDDFFEEFARPVKNTVGGAKAPISRNIMRTDVKENEGNYELHIELPGYKKEDVKAQLKDGYMTITASTDTEKDSKDENGRFIRRERYTGSCSRSFFVGKNTKQEDIQARFEDGVLKVIVPKSKPQVEEEHYIAIEG